MQVNERRALEQKLAVARESSEQLTTAQDSLHEAKAELAQVQAQLERAQEELQIVSVWWGPVLRDTHDATRCVRAAVFAGSCCKVFVCDMHAV